QCINIRDLTFHSGSKYNVYTYNHPQLIHVQPSIFPHLKQLTIYVQSWTHVYQKLCTMIFGNKFPAMESVSLPYANGSCISGIKIWSPNLQYVDIQCCNKSMFYPLLDNLPNLKRFNCGLGTNNSGSLKNRNLPLEQLNVDTYDRSSASYCGSMMSLGELLDVYQCMPNLERTIIFIYDGSPLGRIMDQFNRVLSNCPKLKTFECHIESFGEMESSESADEIKKRYYLFQDSCVFACKTQRGYLRGIKMSR
ncbi:unnamed protein product, partial [Rotaria socialis]